MGEQSAIFGLVPTLKMHHKHIAISFSLVSITFLYPVEGFIVDGVNGNDNYSGETIDDPFETIGRCVQALKNPGDECQIRAGYYHEEVVVTGLEVRLD